jgi:hypothetical protein
MNDDLDPCLGPASSTAICTLFEGDYHLGLAAFVNSLAHSGYRGTVWAGYRGELPPWLHQLRPLDAMSDEYMVADQIRLVFLPVETKLHLTNYKPKFMLDLLAEKACDCEYLWYFDPDIFLRCNWSFFAKWQRYGIALCEEIVNYNLAECSPMRLQWVDLGTALGLGRPRLLRGYFNGGMVGVASSQTGFLEIWKRILDWVSTAGYSLENFKPGTPDMPFNATDQDALNMAAMYTDYPLTTMGPEAMDFVPSGFTMFHAVGAKPWRGSLLLRALAGLPPSNAAKFFFTQASSPIRAYSLWRLRAKLLACAMAAFIGRFYRKR